MNIDGKEYTVNCLIEKEMMGLTDKQGGYAIYVLKFLKEFSVAEKYQLDEIYKQLKTTGIKNMGVVSYAELAVKIGLYLKEQPRATKLGLVQRKRR